MRIFGGNLSSDFRLIWSWIFMYNIMNILVFFIPTKTVRTFRRWIPYFTFGGMWSICMNHYFSYSLYLPMLNKLLLMPKVESEILAVRTLARNNRLNWSIEIPHLCQVFMLLQNCVWHLKSYCIQFAFVQ